MKNIKTGPFPSVMPENVGDQLPKEACSNEQMLQDAVNPSVTEISSNITEHCEKQLAENGK